MQEGRTLVPVKDICWGKLSVPEGIQVHLLVCGKKQFTSARELPMPLLSLEVEMVCSIVLVHGEQEMISPPRACDYWQSLSSFGLSFTATPDGDIRVLLEDNGNGFVERFFFEHGMSFFHSSELTE